MGSRRLLYTAYSALLHDEQVYAVCRANTEMEYHLQINAKAEMANSHAAEYLE
jgi:hypothetical protein